MPSPRVVTAYVVGLLDFSIVECLGAFLFPRDSTVLKADLPIGLALKSVIRHQPIETFFTG